MQKRVGGPCIAPSWGLQPQYATAHRVDLPSLSCFCCVALHPLFRSEKAHFLLPGDHQPESPSIMCSVAREEERGCLNSQSKVWGERCPRQTYSLRSGPLCCFCRRWRPEARASTETKTKNPQTLRSRWVPSQGWVTGFFLKMWLISLWTQPAGEGTPARSSLKNIIYFISYAPAPASSSREAFGASYSRSPKCQTHPALQ